VLGVGIDHVRCHVISWRINEDHMIRHVTCLGASEDYTSRCNLESSKIQHMILKTFRDERRIATKSTIAERFFQREAAHVQGSDNILYCTNRMSLGNLFYAKGTVYIHESHGSYWNVIESNRRSWKAIEPYGSL